MASGLVAKMLLVFVHLRVLPDSSVTLEMKSCCYKRLFSREGRECSGPLPVHNSSILNSCGVDPR